MFIDIHVHTRRLKGFPRTYGTTRSDNTTYATPEEIIAAYDKTGIEMGCILPVCSPESALLPQCNEDVLELAEKYKGRFIPFCNVDPRFMCNRVDAPLEKMLAYYKNLGCKGIGEVTTNMRFDSPFMQNLFRAAEVVDLPLTFHLSTRIGYYYGVVEDAGLTCLERTMQRFPKLKFFGHSQTFWAEIGANPSEFDRCDYPKGKVIEGRVPQLMRKYPNLYGDLSAGSGFNALSRDREYAIKFLNEFQDRLMFGTDIASPDMSDLTCLMDLLKDLRDSGGISNEVFNKVARENAIRLLNL